MQVVAKFVIFTKFGIYCLVPKLKEHLHGRQYTFASLSQWRVLGNLG